MGGGGCPTPPLDSTHPPCQGKYPDTQNRQSFTPYNFGHCEKNFVQNLKLPKAAFLGQFGAKKFGPRFVPCERLPFGRRCLGGECLSPLDRKGGVCTPCPCEMPRCCQLRRLARFPIAGRPLRRPSPGTVLQVRACRSAYILESARVGLCLGRRISCSCTCRSAQSLSWPAVLVRVGLKCEEGNRRQPLCITCGSTARGGVA